MIMKKIFNVVAFSIMLFFASCEQDGLGWKADGIGAFSVSADKQVTFSPSNLSYNEETNQWSFLENQLREGWELGRNSNIRDVFGLKHLEDNGYQDWGVNKIGNDDPNTWRTLTKDEWEYLLYSRKNASDLYGYAVIQAEENGAWWSDSFEDNAWEGLILLPDNWECPEGVVFLSGIKNEWFDTVFLEYDDDKYYAIYYGNQYITSDDWKKMEKNGAVFLRVCSLFKGSWDSKYVGRYYTSTMSDDAYEEGPYILCFDDESDPKVWYHDGGSAVRLVKDL